MNPETPPIALPGSPEKKQQSSDAQKGLRLLAMHLRPLGFERTRPTFFTRPGKAVVEFVHVHKFTYGPAFRIHLGIRIRDDERPGVDLNGPSFVAVPDTPSPSEAERFEYAAGAESIAACAQTMAAVVETAGCEWFEAMRDPTRLRAAGQPLLRSFPMTALREALNRTEAVVTSAATRAALNVDE